MNAAGALRSVAANGRRALALALTVAAAGIAAPLLPAAAEPLPRAAVVAAPEPVVASPGRAGCAAPRDIVRFRQGLPRLARIVGSEKRIVIVAVGSSSTAGSGGGTPQASYPARLDAELDRRFPGIDFEVANYGTGGLLASDMLEEIERTIIPLGPALVVWQTGVTDVIQDVGLAAFRDVLERGIAALKAAGIDVILVNQPFYLRAERVAGYGDYVRVMQEVATARKVPLFRRFAIMKHLVKSGQHTSEALLAPDNWHLNDLTYGCLADLLADAIEARVRAQRAPAAATVPKPR